MLLLLLLTAGMGGTRCARMTLGWGLGLSWAGEGSGGTQPSAQRVLAEPCSCMAQCGDMEPLKWGPGLRATPCVRLHEAGVMEPLQVGGIGCNKIKASMVKEGWRNLPSCCPQLVAAPSVPPQPHLAHPGMPLLGSLHGSCTVPGPGGSKELLAPAALGATWLPLLWVQRPPCRLPAATSQSPAGACGAPGAVMGASGKPLGASPNPRLPFHSAFNFI